MPIRRAQGPEPVEGQAILTRNREHPPSPTLGRDKSSLLQNSAVIDRRYRNDFLRPNKSHIDDSIAQDPIVTHRPPRVNDALDDERQNHCRDSSNTTPVNQLLSP